MIREEERNKASEDYRNFRESCGVKDPIMLDEYIMKAWDWIENNMLSSNQQDKSRLYFEQFKNYMKGE